VVEAGESFSLEVDIAETANVETENLNVNLDISGAGSNETQNASGESAFSAVFQNVFQ